MVEGIKALKAAGSATQIVALPNNASGGFVKSLGNQGHGVIVTQVFPPERSIVYPLAREAQEMTKAKCQNEISPAMLKGFKAAKNWH